MNVKTLFFYEHVASSDTTSVADGGTESTEGRPHSLGPWVRECQCQSICHGHFVEGSGCHGKDGRRDGKVSRKIVDGGCFRGWEVRRKEA